MTNNSENEASLQLSDTTIHGINNVIMTPEPTLNAHNKDEFFNVLNNASHHFY